MYIENPKVIAHKHTRKGEDYIDTIKHTCMYVSCITALFYKYADDTEISKWATSQSFISSQDSVQRCITDVLGWMRSNKVRLNPKKTEVMVTGSQSLLPQITSTFMSINDSLIPYSLSVKYPSSTFDHSLLLSCPQAHLIYPPFSF